MTRRLAYSEIFEMIEKSWKGIKGIKGILWVGFLMTMVTGFPAAIIAGFQGSKFISIPLSGIGHILGLLIFTGLLAIVSKWINKEEKSFDDLFSYLSEWHKIKPIWVLVLLGGVVSSLNMMIAPSQGELPSLVQVILQIMATIILTINYFAVFVTVLSDQCIAPLDAWIRVVVGFFKNIDILFVLLIIFGLILIFGSILTLLIGLIFLIPMTTVMYYELYHRIFTK